MVRKRYPTKHREESWFFSREIVTVHGEYGAVFAQSAGRGVGVGIPLMNLYDVSNLSRITNLYWWGAANTVTSFCIIPAC
jgi:hypothetical protein